MYGVVVLAHPPSISAKVAINGITIVAPLAFNLVNALLPPAGNKAKERCDDLTIGQLAKGFFVTLFGLTPYPETRISCGDLGSGRSEMEDGRSEGEKLKTASNAISNIPDPISAKPAEAGFVQLMCRQNNTKITGSEPLADVNAEGDIATRFQILREWKLPLPDLDAPVKLHRVSCTGSIGMVVVSSLPRAEKKGD